MTLIPLKHHISPTLDKGDGTCLICKQTLPESLQGSTHSGLCNLVMRSYTYYEKGVLRITERGMEIIWNIVRENP